MRQTSLRDYGVALSSLSLPTALRQPQYHEKAVGKTLNDYFPGLPGSLLEKNEPLRCLFFVSEAPSLSSPALSAHLTTGDRQRSSFRRLAIPRKSVYQRKAGEKVGVCL